MSVLTIAACTLDREGTGPAPCTGEPAALKFQLSVNGPSSQANQNYQINVTWKGELLTPNAENTCGNTEPFEITKTYSGNRNSSGDYTIDQLATQERPGIWRFSVVSSNASANCQKTLTPGDTKLVPFTQGQAGC